MVVTNQPLYQLSYAGPFIRHYPIPRQRPPTSLWAEISVRVSRALFPHILPVGLLMGNQWFAFGSGREASPTRF